MTVPEASVVGSVLVFFGTVLTLLVKGRQEVATKRASGEEADTRVSIMRFSLLLSDELDDARRQLADCERQHGASRRQLAECRRRIRALERTLNPR